MNESEELSVWVDRLKQGDEEAAEVIWRNCFERMKQVAKKKLGPFGQRGADEEDIAQSAMKSFMIRCRDGQFEQLDDRDDLWKLLFTITIRKAYQHTRKQTAAKRRGEIGEHRLLGQGDDDSAAVGLDRFADERALTADELMEQLEQQDAFHQVLQNLERSLREVAVGKLSGRTNTQMANQMGCSTRTIERKLKLIRKTWADAS
jgi:RNA polymerase sigma factor (sigma-70 family)